MKKSLLLLSLLLSLNAQSRIDDFETTHMKSTAGAGVGSLLIEESSLLNPASVAFFNVSSIYFQKSGANFVDSSGNPFNEPESGQIGIIGTDSKGGVKGSLSYTKYNQGLEERERYGVSLAKSAGKHSALGISYRFTKDLSFNKSATNLEKEKYKQLTVGLTHLVTPEFSLGFVVVDPLKERENDTRAILGMQYNFKNVIALILDSGADYNQDLADSFLYKAAMQFTVYNNFYIRFGVNRDIGLSKKGTGAGISWIQPKLSIQLALKNTRFEEKKSLRQVESKSKETSFSLSYRF